MAREVRAGVEELDDELGGYWLDRFVTVDEYEPLRAEAEATIERLEER
ncbi:MAG TPA: hypothetical protein P5254_13910 [Aquihabitans sp.]|nr:hypothetical protein [Aquihabitans sp.]